jgi:hypothetical protein
VTDEAELWQMLDHLPGQGRALLRQDHAPRILQAMGKFLGILFRVVVDDYLMTLQLGKTLQVPKGALVIIDYNDLHSIALHNDSRVFFKNPYYFWAISFPLPFVPASPGSVIPRIEWA